MRVAGLDTFPHSPWLSPLSSRVGHLTGSQTVTPTLACGVLPRTQGEKDGGSGQPETQPPRASGCFLSSVRSPAPAPGLLFFQAQEGHPPGVSEEAERNGAAGRVPGAPRTELVNRKLQVHAQEHPGACWLVLQPVAHSDAPGRGLSETPGTVPPTPHARKVWRGRGSLGGGGPAVWDAVGCRTCLLIILAHFPQIPSCHPPQSNVSQGPGGSRPTPGWRPQLAELRCPRWAFIIVSRFQSASSGGGWGERSLGVCSA